MVHLNAPASLFYCCFSVFTLAVPTSRNTSECLCDALQICSHLHQSLRSEKSIQDLPVKLFVYPWCTLWILWWDSTELPECLFLCAVCSSANSTCGSRRQQNSSLHRWSEQPAGFICIHCCFISLLTPDHNFSFQCSVCKAGHTMEVVKLVLTFNTETVRILFLG